MASNFADVQAPLITSTNGNNGDKPQSETNANETESIDGSEKPIKSSTSRKEEIIMKRKRKMEEVKAEKQLKRTKLLTEEHLKDKNPVVILNEYRAGLKYEEVAIKGPKHSPEFHLRLELDGRIFTAAARSKRLAKAMIAEQALQSLVPFPLPTEKCQTPDKTAKAVDVTEGSKLNKLITLQEVATKGPLMILNERFPGVSFEFITLNGNKYEAKTTINGQTFLGNDVSKKGAKTAVARSALNALCNVPMAYFQKMSPAQLANPELIVDFPMSSVPQQLVDEIGRSVLKKFNDLMQEDQKHFKHKVIAGIVMTNKYSRETMKIISIATGTKCISGEFMSETGITVNDTHAEIVSRRGLLDFLYSQLEAIVKTGTTDDTIFEPRPNNRGYRVRDSIKFHLFINTAPCGDARIFSPHETVGPAEDRHPNRKARGQLRTKIESGEGTIPVLSNQSLQTWDGILQGERLLTMSCSDKVCRWNVVGLQGALLSNFIEPIYLDSIILGSLLHPVHFSRAIYGRIEKILEPLTPPFRLNKPNANILTSLDPRKAAKAPPYSVNWTLGQDEAEVLNSVTGKPDPLVDGKISRLTKQAFFHRFLNLYGHLTPINDLTAISRRPMSYSCAKDCAVGYQIAKARLFKAFSDGKLGLWMKKPIEQDMFEL